MGLRIQYASDLHLEFPVNNQFLKQHPLKPEGEILVLAGDIVPFVAIDQHKDFFNYLSDHFKNTYWLPGNHEYYHFDISKKTSAFQESIRDNVFLLNNTSIELEEVKLICTTLWSHINPGHQWHIERTLNDFHLIRNHGHRFSTEAYNQLHQESITFIQQELNNNKDKPLAVFTHHCPTFLHYPVQYKGDILNDAFAVELHHFIASSKITSWVYGHHHTNTPEFFIGNTRMLTNQLGYIQRNEHLGFKTNKIIEFCNLE